MICLKNYVAEMFLCETHNGNVSTNQEEEFTDYAILQMPGVLEGLLTLNADGTVAITTNNTLRVGDTYVVAYSAEVDSKSYVALIKVKIKSFCENQSCDPDEICDECARECVPKTTDLSVEVSEPQIEGGSNLSISIS